MEEESRSGRRLACQGLGGEIGDQNLHRRGACAYMSFFLEKRKPGKFARPCKTPESSVLVVASVQLCHLQFKPGGKGDNPAP